MVTLPLVGHVALLLLSGGLTGWLMVVGWRRRERPGATPFVGLMAVASIWSFGYAGGLVTETRGMRIVWEQVQWFGIAFVPLFILLFFAEYTGFDALQRPTSVLAVATVPVVTLVLVWTNEWHQLVWVETTLIHEDGLTIAAQEFGSWYWVNLFYTYLLTGGGLFIVLYAIRESQSTFTPRLLLLLTGICVPLVVNLASVLGYQPIEGLDMTPYVFGVTGVVFSRAVFDYRLFDRTPSLLHRGQVSALDDARGAVLVTDSSGVVVYRNPAARDLFEADPLDASVEEVLPDRPAPGDERVVRDVGDRVFEVQASLVTDASERHLGTMYLLHDVTRREEHLAELERRQDALERQRARLLELDAINETLRSVNQVLVSSRRPGDVADGLTNRLTAARWYTAATLSDESAECTTVTTVEGPPESRRITIPVRFGSTEYGSLVLETERPDGFTEREVDVLEELAQTTGMALNALETRETLLSDAVVELTYDIDMDASPLAAATAEPGTELTVTSTVPLGDDRILVYADVTAGEPTAVLETLQADPTITEAKQVGNRETLELRLSAHSPLVTAVARGANVVSATATAGTLTLVAETATGASVRELTDALAGEGTAELRSKQRTTPTDAPTPTNGADLDLTPRQAEALEVAHSAGYFGWPRDSTAEEVADAMDIAPATLHSHLRKAQGKLVSTYVEDETE